MLLKTSVTCKASSLVGVIIKAWVPLCFAGNTFRHISRNATVLPDPVGDEIITFLPESKWLSDSACMAVSPVNPKFLMN